ELGMDAARGGRPDRGRHRLLRSPALRYRPALHQRAAGGEGDRGVVAPDAARPGQGGRHRPHHLVWRIGWCLMPSLFMGAGIGSGFAQLVDPFWIGTASLNQGAFAVVGMAAMFSVVGRAPLTAILIVFE